MTGTVNPRVVTVRKQRDLPSGESFAFDLEKVELGTDPETFDPISACVAVYRDVAPPRRTAPNGANQQLLLGGIAERVRSERVRHPGDTGPKGNCQGSRPQGPAPVRARR